MNGIDIKEPSKRYKVQLFSEHNFSWVDVQRSYNNVDDAIKMFPPNKKCRVMCIAGNKRFICHD